MSGDDLQNAEAGYLRRLLLIERQRQSTNNLIITEDRLLRAVRFHICSKACGPFKSLRTGERFLYQEKYWKASGYVFICPGSGKIHLCGINACTHAITSTTCSVIVCNLTGLDLGVGQTLARSRLDRDVFIIGNDIVTTYVFSKKSEGLSESQMNKRIANTVDQIQEAFEANNQKLLSSLASDNGLNPFEEEEKSETIAEEPKFRNGRLDKVSKKDDFGISMEEIAAKESEFLQGIGDPYIDNEAISLSSLIDDDDKNPKRKRAQAKKTVEKTVPSSSSQRFSITPISLFETTSTVYQELLSIANGKEEDVVDITRRFPFLDVNVIKAKLSRRVFLRSSASSVWDVYATTQSHLEAVESRIRKLTTTWRIFLSEYYQECASKGELPNKLHIMNIYCLDVLPHYEGVFYGGDVPAINEKLRPYIVSCMVKLWEKFEEVPAVLSQQISFDTCCAALLNCMKTGLKIDVYLLGNNPKPMIWGNLTITQQNKAVSKTIVFIEPHEMLTLRDTDHVRRGFTADKKKNAGKAIRPIGGKPVYSNRQRASSGGKTKNFSQIIPSLKNLNAILDIVVGNASTIQELESYSLSSILRS